VNVATSQPPQKTFVRKALRFVLKFALGIFVIAVTFVVALLLMMWREHRTTITLPSPRGTFAVGRVTFAWTDDTPVDELAKTPATRRQVLAWVWYPATPPDGEPTAEYLPAAWRAALASRQGRFMSSFFKRDPSVVRTHSFSNAPVSPEESQYPVVLLRAGGSALTTDFTTVAEDLASYGYFVVGFDAPYRSFVAVLPDGHVVARAQQYNVENADGNLADPVIGKLLAMWTSDAKFVVDQLQRLNEDKAGTFGGRIDLNRLGVFGHSFGGATALQFCHDDLRCKAAVDLDGIPFGSVVREGLNKPCMFLLSDHSREMSDPSSHQVLAEIESIYDRLPDGRLYAVIRDANHFSFSDQILLNSQIAIHLLQHTVRFGRLDGRRGLTISSDYVHAFFDVYLKGAPASSLTGLVTKYPEVQISPQ
jgi:pimeloyl-ACP methyl ester carboxylesterase